MSLTEVYLRGLSNCNGETLAVFLAGLDCGDFPVANGSITVPFGSADGLLTERYLTQVSALGRDWGLNEVILDGGTWRVPCVVGYRYTSRGQRLRPVVPQDTGAANGPAFGKLRRNHGIGVLVDSTSGISFGPDFDNLKPALFKAKGGTPYTPTELFSGMHYVIVDEPHSLDGMNAWEVTGPYSAKVAAIGGFLQTSDR